MMRGIVHVVDGREFDHRVLVDEVVEPLRTEAERRDHLAPLPLLVHAGDHTALDEIDRAVREEFGVDAEVSMVAQERQDRVGHGTDAGLQGGAVGDPLGDECADAEIGIAGRFRCNFDERAIGDAPRSDLREVHLVAPERARHLRVGLDVERHLSDERRHVVGVGTERHVAVAVGQRRGRQHHLRLRESRQDQRDLAEVGGNEVDRARRETRDGSHATRSTTCDADRSPCTA